MNKSDVKVYALSTCIHCRDTKEFLNQCGVAFDCVEVDNLGEEQRKNVLEEIKRCNPRCTFPTVVIGDQVIVGFKKDELKEILDL